MIQSKHFRLLSIFIFYSIAFNNIVDSKLLAPLEKINYDFRADMRTGLDFGPMTEEELNEEGVNTDPVQSIGLNRGGNIGIGILPGVQCVEAKPLGEDKQKHCTTLTLEEKNQRLIQSQGKGNFHIKIKLND